MNNEQSTDPEHPCNCYIHHTCGKSGPAELPGDELLRALNALYWHFSYDLRLVIPKILSEASPPILVELNPDGKTFRIPNQKEAQKCRCLQIGPRSGDYDSSECSIHGLSVGKLDLEALARECASDIYAFEDQEEATSKILSALQQSDAAAREESRAKLEAAFSRDVYGNPKKRANWD